MSLRVRPAPVRPHGASTTQLSLSRSTPPVVTSPWGVIWWHGRRTGRKPTLRVGNKPSPSKSTTPWWSATATRSSCTTAGASGGSAQYRDRASKHDLAAARRAFVAGRLGFADLILVSVPPSDSLHERRARDRSRRRHSFDLHVKLAGPLRDWYQAVDVLEPGRVLWGLPTSGLPLEMLRPRLHRSDPARLDELIALLPGPSG